MLQVITEAIANFFIQHEFLNFGIFKDEPI